MVCTDALLWFGMPVPCQSHMSAFQCDLLGSKRCSNSSPACPSHCKYNTKGRGCGYRDSYILWYRQSPVLYDADLWVCPCSCTYIIWSYIIFWLYIYITYVCSYIYIVYVCVYTASIHAYLYIHTCIHMRSYAQLHVNCRYNLHTHTHIYIYIHMYIDLDPHSPRPDIAIVVRIHVYTCTYIRACICTCIHV